MPRLSSYIRQNIEPILDEWETFAQTLPLARTWMLCFRSTTEGPQSRPTSSLE